MDAKPDTQANATDVYAEFTTDAPALQHGCEEAEESFYKAGADAGYSSDDPGSRLKYVAEGQYGDGSDSMFSQGQAEGRGQYERDCDRYQFEGHPCQSGVHPERGDHAQYVPEEYLHFLLKR